MHTQKQASDDREKFECWKQIAGNSVECADILTRNHMVRVAGCVARVRLVVVQIVDLRAVLVSEIQLGSAVIQG